MLYVKRYSDGGSWIFSSYFMLNGSVVFHNVHRSRCQMAHSDWHELSCGLPLEQWQHITWKYRCWKEIILYVSDSNIAWFFCLNIWIAEHPVFANICCNSEEFSSLISSGKRINLSYFIKILLHCICSFCWKIFCWTYSDIAKFCFSSPWETLYHQIP